MMALYQKTYVTRSTICVESFIIVSQSARNALFLVLCRSTIKIFVVANCLSGVIEAGIQVEMFF